METKTLPPDQYLALRSAELDEIEASLNEKFVWLRAERERLVRMAESAGLRKPSEVSADLNFQIFNSAVKRRIPRVQAGTMKAAALEVLRNSERPLSAYEMLPLINEHLGTEYPRSSLSPQLSRLKGEGLITLVGGAWKLTPDNEKASDVNAGERSSEALDLNPEHDREAGQGGGT